MRRRMQMLLLFAVLFGAVPALAQPRSADSEVAFTYGVRAFNHGELDEAVRRFREAVAADPGDGTARYWLGLTLLRQGQSAAAAAEIAASLAAERPPNVEHARVEEDLRRARGGAASEAVSVPGFLGEAVTPTRQPPLLEARAIAGYGKDSNPAQLPPGYAAVFPGGTVLRAEDSDGVANLRLRAEVRPIRDRSGWTLSLLAQGDQSDYQDLGFFDARQLTGLVQLSRGSSPQGFLIGPFGYTRVPAGWDRVQVLLQAGVTRTELDGDPVVQTTLAAATFKLQGAKRATQLDLSYQDLDFDQTFSPVDEKDGELASLKLSQTFSFGQRGSYLRLSGQVGDRSAGPALEHRFLEAGLEAALRPWQHLLLSLAGSLREEDYDRPESNPLPLPRPRGDDVSSAEGALVWELTPAIQPFVRVGYTDRDSDFIPAAGDAPRDFSRTRTSFGVTLILQSSR